MVKKSTGHELQGNSEIWLAEATTHTCPVMVYTTAKSPLVENIVHGWKNDMDTNVTDII